MIRAFACCLLVALTIAEEAEPSTVDASFVGLPALFAQPLLQRRLADITLGMQVAQGFASFAAIEYQKFNPTHAAQPSSFEEQADVEELQQHEARSFSKSRKELEEMKDAQELEEMGADEFLQLKEEVAVDLEQQSTNAKNSALKALHLQLYLSAGDVENSYWISKAISLVAPQFATFKLYKSYLNTIALSTAYQLHDAYTFESVFDDFNDKFDSTALATEAHAEVNVYRNWYTLAMIKWQLFMISIYEQSMTGGAHANANAANSFLETESQEQFFGMAGNGMNQYAYMAYYVMMLKYYSLYNELMLAQAGLNSANIKVSILTAKDVPESTAHQLDELEGKHLPHLYAQWAQTNQMKYMMEYYMLMFDMQSPAYAASQAVRRAEETFINLFQTQKAETTPTAPSN